MGREPEKRVTPATMPSAEEVAAYLRHHPDFLSRVPDLAAHLVPPSPDDRGPTVVDLQSYLLDRLRAEVKERRREHDALLATARANANNQARIHAAVLFLLDARSLEHLIQIISTDLAVLLDLDVACLIVESTGFVCANARATGVHLVEIGVVDRLLGGRDLVLRRGITGGSAAFGPGAGLVASEALIRITVSDHAPDGLLALGSRDPDMFHPGQGTELIDFLARVVERCIRDWLDLPPPA